MNMQVNLGGAVSGLTGLSGADLDIETLLMTVQTERVRLQETLLAEQIGQIKSRSDKVAALNELLSVVNMLSRRFTDSTKAGQKLKDTTDWDKDKAGATKALEDAVKAAGVTYEQLAAGGVWIDPKNLGDSSLGMLMTAVDVVRGSIDSNGSTQQMDMLRMQNLSNKRNEAFDIMTNFIKKMHEGRSSIIGNLR